MRNISKNSERLKGRKLAITGIAVSCVTLVWSILIVLLFLFYVLCLPVVISP
jgi:hypothetical protein